MRSIRSRLILYMLTASIIPVVAFLFYTLLFVSNGLIETELDSHETKVSWANQYLGQLTKQLDDVMYSIHLEENLLQMVDDSATDNDEIENVLRSALFNNSNILSKVTIISANSFRGVSIDYESGFASKTYQYSDLFLSQDDEQAGLEFAVDGPSIYVIHTINDFETRKFNGIIILKLNQTPVEELGHILGKDSDYILHTSMDDIINNTDYDLLEDWYVQQSYTPYQNQNDNTYVWTKRVGGLDLYISLIVQESQVEAFGRTMIGVGVLIVLVSFGVTIVISLIFSNDITAPVTTLATHMSETNLKRFPSHKMRFEEIQSLEKSYNTMIDDINNLITLKYQNEIERQSIQLKALQAQINPHFLSNTFQLIGGMAMDNKIENVYDATIKMSKLVRYSMRIDQEAVTIQEELDHTMGYLDIQQLRYGDRLSFHVDIPENVTSLKVPKFTLQPILENSFKYGLKKVDRPWQINITSTITDHVILRVEDNGIGMKKSVISEINSLLTKTFNPTDPILSNDIRGIGLANINARIKLLYGNEYGIQLQSGKENGLITLIHLPYEGGVQ